MWPIVSCSTETIGTCTASVGIPSSLARRSGDDQIGSSALAPNANNSSCRVMVPQLTHRRYAGDELFQVRRIGRRERRGRRLPDEPLHHAVVSEQPQVSTTVTPAILQRPVATRLLDSSSSPSSQRLPSEANGARDPQPDQRQRENCRAQHDNDHSAPQRARRQPTGCGHQSMPYFSSNRFSRGRDTPSNCAARALCPPVAAITR